MNRINEMMEIIIHSFHDFSPCKTRLTAHTIDFVRINYISFPEPVYIIMASIKIDPSNIHKEPIESFCL